MNKKNKYLEKNKILQEIRYSNRSGSHCNCFRAYASEGELHIRKKFELWLSLIKQGYEVYTEVIFNDGCRADILAFKDGIWEGFEIIVSEKKEDCLEKIKKYPEVSWEIR